MAFAGSMATSVCAAARATMALRLSNSGCTASQWVGSARWRRQVRPISLLRTRPRNRSST